MTNETLTVREVIEQMAELYQQGVEEPWREFVAGDGQGASWEVCLSPEGAMPEEEWHVRRRKPTVKVTCPDGEVLELPKPEAGWVPPLSGWVVTLYFQARSDVQAWADAMPKIRGVK